MKDARERVLERLKNEVERLRRYERGVREVAALRTHVSQVLAAITWAEDLEEARDLASRALRDGLDHDASPPTN